MRKVASPGLAILAVAVLTVVAAPEIFAAPKVAFGNLTASQFIKSCRDMGGTSTHVGGGAIKCTLPSGTEVTCAFDAGGSVCTWDGRLPQNAQKQLMGDPAPNAVNSNTANPPKAPTTTGGSNTVN